MDVVLYARLSREDASDGLGLSATKRQLADCQAHAAREGWHVVRVYEDPDHTASDPRRKRPEFERMLSDLGDGVGADGILVWKLDRLLRQPREAEQVLDLADRKSLRIVSLNDPLLDLTTPTGRANFRQTIIWAKLESETMSLRIRRKMEDMAKAGVPGHGGIRPFGLTKDRASIVPGEAALIREAADRILAGEPLWGVVKDWARRGIRTPGTSTVPQGRLWTTSSLKRMLLAPRIAGDRSHRGLVAARDCVPPMVDRSKWERLRNLLKAPRGTGGGTTRKHYLTGVAYCGRCGSRLQGVRTTGGVARYACRPPEGCGAVVIKAEYVETLIAEAIALRLDSPEFIKAVRSRERRDGNAVDLERLRADEQALEELATAYFADRAITKPEYERARSVLVRRIAQTRRAVQRATSDGMTSALAGIDVRARWATESVPWRSAVARAMLERIVVNPAPRRGTRFDPSRIDVVWRDRASA